MSIYSRREKIEVRICSQIKYMSSWAYVIIIVSKWPHKMHNNYWTTISYSYSSIHSIWALSNYISYVAHTMDKKKKNQSVLMYLLQLIYDFLAHQPRPKCYGLGFLWCYSQLDVSIASRTSWIVFSAFITTKCSFQIEMVMAFSILQRLYRNVNISIWVFRTNCHINSSQIFICRLVIMSHNTLLEQLVF